MENLITIACSISAFSLGTFLVGWFKIKSYKNQINIHNDFFKKYSQYQTKKDLIKGNEIYISRAKQEIKELNSFIEQVVTLAEFDLIKNKIKAFKVKQVELTEEKLKLFKKAKPILDERERLAAIEREKQRVLALERQRLQDIEDERLRLKRKKEREEQEERDEEERRNRRSSYSSSYSDDSSSSSSSSWSSDSSSDYSGGGGDSSGGGSSDSW